MSSQQQLIFKKQCCFYNRLPGGCRPDDWGQGMEGHFGEVIAFGTKLPDTTRQKVKVTCTQMGANLYFTGSHPYKSSKPLGWNPPCKHRKILKQVQRVLGLVRRLLWHNNIGLTAGETYYRLRSQGELKRVFPEPI